MVAPKAGTDIKIQSYKHNGIMHRVWESTMVLKGTEQVIIGANDKTMVVESDGRTWITREPAICYFHSKHWFNIIGMLRDDGIHYYCNISSPFVFEENAIKYIDYDLDLKVYPDMTYDVLDEDEYQFSTITSKTCKDGFNKEKAPSHQASSTNGTKDSLHTDTNQYKQ